MKIVEKLFKQMTRKQAIGHFKVILTMATLFLLNNVYAINILGPLGSGKFGADITVLTNGNYVVCDPLFDDGAKADVGAAHLYNGKTHTLISTLKGSTANDNVGAWGAIALPNGNFLVQSPFWNNGAVLSTGALTWVNGTSGLSGTVSSSNSLVGSTKNDGIGAYVYVLKNGNYLVVASSWDNGSVQDAGAVAWGNGSSGTSGVISTSNALVGSTNYDKVGEQQVGGTHIFLMPNGNYIVMSPLWDNGSIVDAGAATWGDGNIGVSGVISSSNSLVGGRTKDQVGTESYIAQGGVRLLSNGNYVVISPFWNDGIFQYVGAVTFGNGNTGVSGVVSSMNSLVGDTTGDYVGGSGVTALTNGHYVVNSGYWDNGSIQDAGAVTWCNGTTGTTGVVSKSNSLTGTKVRDYVGSGGSAALSNGHYVANSPSWGDGNYGSVGAVTWCNGTTGRTGNVTISNSLVGSYGADKVGSGGIIALPNGHYVVGSYEWNNGTAYKAGAVTWCDGTVGRTGKVSATNSLVGSTLYDDVGSNGNNSSSIYLLPNGNYVVLAPYWDNGTKQDVGAVIWCNGNTGRSGVLTAAMALTGSSPSDAVGAYGLLILPNSSYVVRSPYWNNGSVQYAGAVTWCNGTTGRTGVVSAANSLVGENVEDNIGEDELVVLKNGNYVVKSREWGHGLVDEVGAVTWGNGSTGVSGVVSGLNSLVGCTRTDMYYSYLTALSNGDYVVRTETWDNGQIGDAGSVTYASGTKGLTGSINACNSILGNTSIKGKEIRMVFDSAYNYLLVGIPYLNNIEIFEPYSETLAVHLDKKNSQITANSFTTVENNCRLLASLDSKGALPLEGLVDARVWVETAQPDSFVKRHYQFVPATNATTASSRVTLYFTQVEFDAYNLSHDNSKLPINSSDAAGKANLRIEKRSGSSSDSSGMPNTYTGNLVTINPDDKDIVWNANFGRWEITFNTLGYGGFFIRTPFVPITGLSKNMSTYAATLFPNPSDGKVSIQTWEDKGTDVLVYDMQGKLIKATHIKQAGVSELDLGVFSPGIYLVYLSSGEVFKLNRF